METIHIYIYKKRQIVFCLSYKKQTCSKFYFCLRLFLSLTSRWHCDIRQVCMLDTSKCKGCWCRHHLTRFGEGALFVTPDDIIQQTPVGLSEFSSLFLSSWRVPVPPALNNRQLTLCIHHVAMKQEVKGVFQTDLEEPTRTSVRSVSAERSLPAESSAPACKPTIR